MPSVLTYQPRKTIIPNQLKEWNRMTKGDSKEIRKDRVWKEWNGWRAIKGKDETEGYPRV